MLSWRRERCDNQNRQTYHNSQLHALNHLWNSPEKRREKRKKILIRKIPFDKMRNVRSETFNAIKAKRLVGDYLVALSSSMMSVMSNN